MCTATLLYYSSPHYYFIPIWLTLIALTPAPIYAVAGHTEHGPSVRDVAFSSHLNFTVPFTPPFNLAYNDAIRIESIWKFFGEGLMFRGFWR